MMYSVRGKRRKPSALDHVQRSRRSRRGRPMKRVEELTTPRDARNAQLQRLQRQAIDGEVSQEVHSSPLEQLPNELIQQIFFHCFEVSLPRASLRLAQALSTDSTYNALILFAYFEDNEKSPVETRLFLPAAYRRLGLEDRIRLQEETLRCRWLTLDRLRTCMPSLSRLAMAQAWHMETQDDQSATTRMEFLNQADATAEMEIPQITAATPALQHLAPLPGLGDTEASLRHFFAWTDPPRTAPRLCGSTGHANMQLEDYLPRIITWGSEVMRSGPTQSPHWYKSPLLGKSILAARVIPDWLVKGNPWTEDKTQMLRLLREGSRFVSFQHTNPLRVSAAGIFEGMASAIHEKRTTVLKMLLEIHNDVFDDSRPQPQHASLSLTSPSLHPIPVHLFRAATKAGPESSEYVWLLIRGGLAALPKDDRVLTAWALSEQAEGNSVARYVLDHMSDRIDYDSGQHVQEYLFRYGRLNASALLNPPMSAGLRFDEELGYLQGNCRITSLMSER